MQGTIDLQSVSKSYRDPSGIHRSVLDGVSIVVEAGGNALIDGPSGAGKSTLLNIFSGLVLPDSGKVTIGGVELPTLSESRRDRFRAQHIGYIFQSFNLISPLSILENLTLPMYLNGSSKGDLEDPARNILKRFGLLAHAYKHPYQLSVGQRQRVAVARAILHRPALLLADEPTASLDANSADAVIDAIEELQSGGTTLVVATHDPALKRLSFDVTLDLGAKEVAA